MANLQITGVPELLKRLEKAQAIRVLQSPMQRAVLRLQRAMATYPPAPPRSRYRRTGTLGRRWTARVTQSSNGITGKVGNNTVYGPLVQSARFQRGIHKRTGWITDEQAMNQTAPAIVLDFKRAIDEALR